MAQVSYQRGHTPILCQFAISNPKAQTGRIWGLVVNCELHTSLLPFETSIKQKQKSTDMGENQNPNGPKSDKCRFFPGSCTELSVEARIVRSLQLTSQ